MTLKSQEFTEEGKKVNQALETEVDALNLAAKGKEDLAESTDKAAISNEAFAGSAEEAALREQGIIKIITEAGVEYRKLGEAVDAAGISAEQSGDKAKEGADKTKKSIEEATKEAIELKVALLDLEGIKVQAQAEVNVAQIEQAGEALVAQIEQQTEVSVANIESIGQSIESTGDLLGDLFDAFNQAESTWDQSFIEGQIRAENRRRDDLLELQRDQAEAVIRNLDARTQALKRGDALIKIEAQNLIEPLEVIWLEIMRQIQIRASSEGAEYLLSIAETSGFTQGETGTQSQSSPT